MKSSRLTGAGGGGGAGGASATASAGGCLGVDTGIGAERCSEYCGLGGEAADFTTDFCTLAGSGMSSVQWRQCLVRTISGAIRHNGCVTLFKCRVVYE